MISRKKLATIGATAALFAATAVPAFASGPRVNQSNSGDVDNNITVSSNTGGNSSHGHSRHGGITTGNATTEALVGSSINGNLATVNSCECEGGRVRVRQSNSGDVDNNITVSSNTGNNHGKRVRTGDAYTGATVASLVNSNVAVVGN